MADPTRLQAAVGSTSVQLARTIRRGQRDAEVAAPDAPLYSVVDGELPVCTAEACAFRDNFAGVSRVGVQIVGVSPQSVGSHRRFSNSFSIPFPLMSDPRKKVIRAYGVDGPPGFVVRRVTFLIDSSKVIENRVVAELSVGFHTDLLKETLHERKVASGVRALQRL